MPRQIAVSGVAFIVVEFTVTFTVLLIKQPRASAPVIVNAPLTKGVAFMDAVFTVVEPVFQV